MRQTLIGDPKEIVINGTPLNEILALHAEWEESGDKKGRKADLTKTMPAAVDLLGANLMEADLHRAFLKRADLSSAILCKADLNATYLRVADLSGAEISNFKNIIEAEGSNAADFTDAIMDDETREFLSKINTTVKPLEKPEKENPESDKSA